MLNQSPIDNWTLSLPNDANTRQLFDADLVDDVLLVVNYSAQTPEWPM